MLLLVHISEQTSEPYSGLSALQAHSKHVYSYENPLPDPELTASFQSSYSKLPVEAFSYSVEKVLHNWRTKWLPLVDELKDVELAPPNHMQGPFDLAMIWAMTLSFKPNRVVEIGSGFSSHAFDKARTACKKRFPRERSRCAVHTAIEPYRTKVLEGLEQRVEILPLRLQEVDLSVFKQMEANDILFIDSSHVIQPHGDVIMEFLFILPLLKPGVVVHVHDIFLPYDYLPNWMSEGRPYTEQWLLAALLMNNDAWEILWPGYAMVTEHLDSLNLPNHVQAATGSFWIRKVK